MTLPRSPAAEHLSVAHLVAPARFGGLETVVQTLALGHRRRGHRVAVVATLEGASDGHPFFRPLRESGVEVIPLALPGRAYRREWRYLRRFFRDWRPDVVHTHGYRPDVLGGGAARASGIAVASTVHGFTGGGWKNRLFERLQRRAFRGMDAVVAVSAPLHRELRQRGIPAERLHLIPNAWAASEVPLKRAEARRELEIPPERYAIGWVGRLSAEKGADVLVDACAELKGLDGELHVIGDGPAGPSLRARTETAAFPLPVRWHGALEGAARLFPAFDLYVLSSRTEGTPIALLEAIAAGVPVVATRVGGVPDVVGPEEALLVAPEDPRALAEAIRGAYVERHAAAVRAAAARERLRSHFGVEPWLDSYEQIYRAARARHPPASPFG